MIEALPRNPLDSIQYLHSNKLAACRIEARPGFEIVHFTLHYDQMKQIRRLRDAYTRPIYIKIGAEEIRTTLQEIKFFQHMKFYELATFQRYIVGDLNKIKVPVYFENVKHYRMELQQIEYDHPEVTLFSTNDINPASIKLDVYRLIRRGVYCFGDLHNILPPGLSVAPPHNKVWSRAIARLIPLKSKKYEDVVTSIKQSPELLQKTDQALQEKEFFEEDELEPKQKKKPQEEKKEKRMFSVKLQMKEEKQKFQQMVQDRMKQMRDQVKEDKTDGK